MKLGDEGSSCSVATAAVVIRKAAMVVATRRNDILKIQKHQERQERQQAVAYNKKFKWGKYQIKK